MEARPSQKVGKSNVLSFVLGTKEQTEQLEWAKEKDDMESGEGFAASGRQFYHVLCSLPPSADIARDRYMA